MLKRKTDVKVWVMEVAQNSRESQHQGVLVKSRKTKPMGDGLAFSRNKRKEKGFGLGSKKRKMRARGEHTTHRFQEGKFNP